MQTLGNLRFLIFIGIFFSQLKQTSVPPSQLLLWAVGMVGVQFFRADFVHFVLWSEGTSQPAPPFLISWEDSSLHVEFRAQIFTSHGSPIEVAHLPSREAWLWADWSSTDFQVWDIGFTQSTKLLADSSEPLRDAITSAGSISLCPAVLVECGSLRMSYFPRLMLIISLLSVAGRLTQKGLGSLWWSCFSTSLRNSRG